MPENRSNQDQPAVSVYNTDGRALAVIVCEHASNHIPDEYRALGLAPDLLTSHIAWDPGALPVARALSDRLNAPLVAGGLSRLLFDCNRPPEAVDAIPEKSELYDIPGNLSLGKEDREQRIRGIHDPFQEALSGVVAGFSAPPVIITVHSFTPVYKGETRSVEIGLLHDKDDRLARAMHDCASDHTDCVVELNAPYDATDGVTHTLRRHALPIGAINVMLEIRNDLIGDTASQTAMAEMLSGWIVSACETLGSPVKTAAPA